LREAISFRDFFQLCICKEIFDRDEVLELFSDEELEERFEKLLTKKKPSIWRVLQIKDTSLTTDAAYVQWQKEGELEIFPRLWELRKYRTKLNAKLKQFLQLERLKPNAEQSAHLEGHIISFKKLIPLIFKVAKNECKTKAFVLPEKVQWKVTLDGRIIGNRREVLLSIVPLNLGLNVQSELFTFPLGIVIGDEIDSVIRELSRNLVEEMKELRNEGFTWNGMRREFDFFLAADLKMIWLLTGLSYLKKLDQFCTYCKATKEKRADREAQKDMRETLSNIFDIPPNRIVFCTLHATLRITEKLLSILCSRAMQNGVQDEVAAAIRQHCNVKLFSIWKSEKSGEVKFSPLCGYNLKKLVNNFSSFVPLIENHEQRQLKRDSRHGTHWDVWEKWKEILAIFSKKEFNTVELDDNRTVDTCLQAFFANFCSLVPEDEVTPYIHIVRFHSLQILRQHGSFYPFSQQGLEASNQLHQRLFLHATNRNGTKNQPSSIEQVFLKVYHCIVLQPPLWHLQSNVVSIKFIQHPL
jgi:hypothetical protein